MHFLWIPMGSTHLNPHFEKSYTRVTREMVTLQIQNNICTNLKNPKTPLPKYWKHARYILVKNPLKRWTWQHRPIIPVIQEAESRGSYIQDLLGSFSNTLFQDKNLAEIWIATKGHTKALGLEHELQLYYKELSKFLGPPPESCSSAWPMLSPGTMVSSGPKLLLRAMSASMVLLQLGSVLMLWPVLPQRVRDIWWNLRAMLSQSHPCLALVKLAQPLTGYCSRRVGSDAQRRTASWAQRDGSLLTTGVELALMAWA